MKSESQLRAHLRTDARPNVSASAALPLTAGAMFGVVVLAAIFFAQRAQDVGQLPALLREFFTALGRVRIIEWATFGGNVIACLSAVLIAAAWFGLGTLVQRWLRLEAASLALRIAWAMALGASLWALLWFALGLTGLFRRAVAWGLLLLGLSLAVAAIIPLIRHLIKQWPQRAEADEYWLRRISFIVITSVCTLALIAALAPPTGKDALVYRLAVPKAYLAAGGIVDVTTNVYSYLSFGAEMHGVWAMLLGQFVNPMVAESAFGAMCFAWLPLLCLATYGCAREWQLSRSWSWVATAFVVAIPSLYQVAATGYVDHSLALFVVLAVQAAGKWWATQSRQSLLALAFALGGALAVKFIALFAFFPLFIVVLFKARAAQQNDPQQTNAILLSGCAALLFAGLLASPWYLRTWARTGSPVYPFYAHLWNGSSPNWDADRSRLFQMWVARYGGDEKSLVEYVAMPLRLSLTAQPEQAAQFDGVLGISFLLGLPTLLWGLWRLVLPVDVKIALAVAGGWYVGWLFSSQQLRFLLPIFPVLAVAIVAAASRISSRALQWVLLASVVPGVLVIAAWFLEQNPLCAVLGGETREDYLTRRLEHYPYYKIVNRDLPPTARVWLINMRNDTVHFERDYFADYIFEDYTIAKLVREAANVAVLRAQVKDLGITHVLLRHDVLFDYARTPIVDERKSAAENEGKLQLLKSFLEDGTKIIKRDAKFLLVELPA
jgi:hypothetical protein